MCFFLFVPPRSLGRSSPNLAGRWRAAPDISLRGSFLKGQGHRGQRSNLSFFLFSSVYVLFEIVCVCVCICVCLICLHRRNHLTATSRRVKFTSIENVFNLISYYMF